MGTQFNPLHNPNNLFGRIEGSSELAALSSNEGNLACPTVSDLETKEVNFLFLIMRKRQFSYSLRSQDINRGICPSVGLPRCEAVWGGA